MICDLSLSVYVCVSVVVVDAAAGGYVIVLCGSLEYELGSDRK